MEKRFDIPRTIGRKAPKHPATAAVLYRQSPWDRQSRWDSQQLAYGVLTNVSATGACIVIDSWLAPGSDVDLKLSFYQQPCLHEIAARVVWSEPAGARETGLEGLPLHGVQFTLSSALQKSRLHTLLEGVDFVDASRLPLIQFNLFMTALAGERDELGSKMRETTGEEIVPLPTFQRWQRLLARKPATTA